MKNKIYAFILMMVMSISLAACSNDNHTVDIPEPEVKEEVVEDTNNEEEDTTEIESEPEEVEEEIEEEPAEDYSNKEPVKLVLTMFSFSNETIEEYIAGLQEKNPGTIYEVYDEKHYTMEIEYAKYMETKKNMKDVDILDKSVKDFLSDEQYGGAFVRAEYDDLITEVKLYVNKEAYEKNTFVCNLGGAFFFAMISDSYQAYNDIAPEDRELKIVYIDNDTMEELSSTDTWGN